MDAFTPSSSAARHGLLSRLHPRLRARPAPRAPLRPHPRLSGDDLARLRVALLHAIYVDRTSRLVGVARRYRLLLRHPLHRHRELAERALRQPHPWYHFLHLHGDQSHGDHGRADDAQARRSAKLHACSPLRRSCLARRAPHRLYRLRFTRAAEFVRPRIVKLFRISPVGVAGCFAVGLANGAFWCSGPVSAQNEGFEVNEIAVFMSAVVLGGALAQWPLGSLSDRIDRRIVMVVAAIIAMVAALALCLPRLTKSWWSPPALCSARLSRSTRSPSPMPTITPTPRKASRFRVACCSSSMGPPPVRCSPRCGASCSTRPRCSSSPPSCTSCLSATSCGACHSACGGAGSACTLPRRRSSRRPCHHRAGDRQRRNGRAG